MFFKTAGCLNTITYSYIVRSSPNDEPYVVYEPVVFSYCEIKCTNDSKCAYFKFTNDTKNCQIFDEIEPTKWRESCSGCFIGIKEEICLTQPEETTIPGMSLWYFIFCSNFRANFIWVCQVGWKKVVLVHILFSLRVLRCPSINLNLCLPIMHTSLNNYQFHFHLWYASCSF